jgi:hypothetical protein
MEEQQEGRGVREGLAERRLKKFAMEYEITAERRMRAFGHTSARPSWIRRFVSSAQYHFLPHYWGAPPGWRLRARNMMGRKRTLPDFYIVGPMKGATSDLAVHLLTHPNVMPPLAKEVRGAHPEQWRLFYPTEKQKLRHARRHGVALTPFLSPFLDFMELTYNVARVQPEAKVVITLRNPVDRVFSHWKWEYFLSGSHRATYLSFLSTFSAFVDESLSRYGSSRMYTACGSDALLTSIYWRSVKYWIDSFGPGQVLVLDAADYFRDRVSYLDRIFDFVGLPRFQAPKSSIKINENPVQVPPADEASVAKLRDFFEPHNEKLWNVIGKRFDW